MVTKKEFKDAAQGINIFLDMDGVIADIDTHGHDTGMYKADGKLDYDNLDYDWWLTIPVFKGAKNFYYDLKKHGQVRFLTAPIPTPDCYGGKAAWISNKFLPEKGRFALLDLIICRGTDKRFLAGNAKHILIDDREKNIREWEDAGGTGILHQGDFKETLKKLQDVLENQKNANKPIQPRNGPRPAY